MSKVKKKISSSNICLLLLIFEVFSDLHDNLKTASLKDV